MLERMPQATLAPTRSSAAHAQHAVRGWGPRMIRGARYVHTNVVARDWRALAAFYQSVFGCIPVPPERNYSGRELEVLTGVHGAALTGAHLLLPGSAADGPTLEIFQYSVSAPGPGPTINCPGLAHIAFTVDSVDDARREVLEAGGAAVGDVTLLTTATGAQVNLCYVTDPEGNIIEFMAWGQQAPTDNAIEPATSALD